MQSLLTITIFSIPYIYYLDFCGLKVTTALMIYCLLWSIQFRICAAYKLNENFVKRKHYFNCYYDFIISWLLVLSSVSPENNDRRLYSSNIQQQTCTYIFITILPLKRILLLNVCGFKIQL